MSKLSQIQLDLTEQANELGFEDIEEAEVNGYEITYNGKGWKLTPDANKAYEERYKEWNKEKQKVIRKLQLAKSTMRANNYFECADRVAEAIKFIKGIKNE